MEDGRDGAPRDAARSQSLERGLAILSSFGSRQPLRGVSELSREVGLTRSTAHRYVSTLTALGYLQQDLPTRKYRLGPRVVDLGFAAINSMGLRDVAVPHLRALCDATEHTVNMAVLDGGDVVYVERCRASRNGQVEIDLDLHVGSRVPAYCTSMGKVLLAHLPPRRRDALVAELELVPRGPNTITDPEELLVELDRVRERGLAVSDEELAHGLRSIAAPVRSQTGEVVAAINLAVHRSMLSREALVDELGPRVRKTADDISAHVGYGGLA